MRLLLRLIAKNDQKDVSLEYHKLQGYVYSLLAEAGFPLLHDKPGYKPFCFSNIFPFGDMKEGDVRHFMIASPGTTIPEHIASYLTTTPSARVIHIGDCAFTLDGVRITNSTPGPGPVRIITATPILLRIPEYNYDVYAIPEEERRPKYVYWRPQISFEAFIKQLTENMVKKYNDSYGTSVGSFPLFQDFIFKKTVHTRYIIDGKSYGVAGSLWEFSWSHMDGMQRKIIEFGLDAGFGERNSFGFGFVNVVKAGEDRR
jgi:CRISPR-associated endoribonuclease Cas6